MAEQKMTSVTVAGETVEIPDIWLAGYCTANKCSVEEAVRYWLWQSELAAATDAGQRSCPDCEQGKHRNCTGEAWDVEADDFCVCPCEAAGHG